MMTHSSRWNPHWHSATVCINFVFSPCLSVTQPNAKSQPDGLRETGGGRLREYVSVPLSLCLWWCPAISPAQCAWSSPAAAASFPGTEPSLFQPLLYSDLDGQDGGRCGRQFYTISTYLDSNMFWIPETILCSIFASFVSSNHLFKSILPLNKS